MRAAGVKLTGGLGVEEKWRFINELFYKALISNTNIIPKRFFVHALDCAPWDGQIGMKNLLL
jgi:hypothetical protein